jgi:hypothetical protein
MEKWRAATGTILEKVLREIRSTRYGAVKLEIIYSIINS